MIEIDDIINELRELIIELEENPQTKELYKYHYDGQRMMARKIIKFLENSRGN